MINIDAMPQPTMQDALEQVARRSILLVACDYDGVLAEHADTPTESLVDRQALAALHRLAELPCTHVAIVSGRGRAELRRAIGHPGQMLLVGSHGAELPGAASPDSPSGRLDSLASQVAQLASRWPGALIERKPLAVAVHHHRLPESEASALVWTLLNGPARMPGVRVRSNARFLELCMSEADKGVALAHLRQRTGATATVFLGEDVAASDALRGLGAHDLGITIGPCLGADGAPTHALADVRRAATALGELAGLRAEWAMGRQSGQRDGQRDGQPRPRRDHAAADRLDGAGRCPEDRLSDRVGGDGDRRLDWAAIATTSTRRMTSCAMLSLVGPGGFAFA